MKYVVPEWYSGKHENLAVEKERAFRVAFDPRPQRRNGEVGYRDLDNPALRYVTIDSILSAIVNDRPFTNVEKPNDQNKRRSSIQAFDFTTGEHILCEDGSLYTYSLDLPSAIFWSFSGMPDTMQHIGPSTYGDTKEYAELDCNPLHCQALTDFGQADLVAKIYAVLNRDSVDLFLQAKRGLDG